MEDAEIRDIAHKTLRDENGISHFDESHYEVARAVAEFVRERVLRK